jgi:hypothetical protein
MFPEGIPKYISHAHFESNTSKDTHEPFSEGHAIIRKEFGLSCKRYHWVRVIRVHPRRTPKHELKTSLKMDKLPPQIQVYVRQVVAINASLITNYPRSLHSLNLKTKLECPKYTLLEEPD